jgi:3-oxoacyl-[acyl-carrier protein] reductase
MNSDLVGKVVLVTGAAGGIGSAIARGFAEEGARLVLHYRSNRAGAAALGAELKGAEPLMARADLTREAEVKRLFAAAVKRFGRVDVLVANAGAWETRDVPLHEMPLKQWRWTLDHVLTATFLSLREFMRRAAKQKRGNAVLIASTAGIFGEAGHADYASAKAAMAQGLTRTAKNEIARIAPHTADYCGGRVNCVCPGWTLVPRTASRLGDAAAVRRVTATMALPKIARPEDIANATVFLASDRLAGHVTGQTLVVAGGMEGRWLWRPEEVDPGMV